MLVLQNNNFVEIECPHCKSKLGVHLEDITYNEIAYRTPPFTATCGACEKMIGVPEASMPGFWIHKLVMD